MQLKSHSDNYIGNFLGHENEIRTLTFSHDKKWLISGGWDTRIHIWQLESNVRIEGKIRNPIGTIRSHSDSITSLFLTKDQHYLISGSKDGTIQVHNLIDLTSIHTSLNLSNLMGRIFTVTMNPLENLLVSGGDDKIIHVWSFDSGRIGERKPTFHENILHQGGTLHGIHFNSEGTRFVAFGDDSYIYIYRVEQNQTPTIHLERNLTYHRKWVYTVAFHPNLPILVSGGQEKKCFICSYDTGEVLHIVPLSAPIAALHFHPDGQFILVVTFTNDLHLISAETGQICATHHIGYGSRITVGISPDWTLLAVAPFGISPPVIKVWRFSP